MVMRREDRLAPDVFVQVLAHRPRDREPVPRRRAASDLVQQHQAPRRRRVQDRTRLRHLHHERRLPAHEIVARTHTREHPVGDPHPRRRRRHIAPHLRHQHQQTYLSQYGTFPGHVRTGQDDHPRIGRERHVVRDELVARHHPLHHRMPPAHDLERRPVVHHRPHIALARRDLGERRQHVELRTPLRHPLQPCDLRAHTRAQRVEQLALECLHPFGRVQHLLLELLQCRRDVTLRPGERLPPLIVARHEILVRVRDLDVVTEHPVVADLERVDPGPRTLLRLERRDRILSAGRDRAQLVERCVHAGSDRLTVAERERWPRHECRLDLRAQLRRVIPRRRDRAEPAGECRAPHRGRHRGKARERVAQRAQVARSGASRCRAASKTLHVAYAVQRLTQRGARERLGEQRRHRVESRHDRRHVGERREDPVAHQPRAHRRLRPVEHAEQGAARERAARVGARVGARAQRLHEFEVAPRHLVERHRAAGTLHHRAREMRQSTGLQFAQVAQ